jgi:DNA-directed RNA polymerase, mitochondrial
MQYRDPELVQKQFELEGEQTQIGIDRYRKERHEILVKAMKSGKSFMIDQLHESMPPERRLISFALPKVSLAIDEYLSSTNRIGKVAGAKNTLSSIDPDSLAFIVLRRLINAIYQVNNVFQDVCISIAEDIRFEVFYQQFAKEKKRYLAKIMDNIKTKSRVHQHRVIVHAAKSKGYKKPKWTQKDKCVIGGKLASIAIETTNLFEVSLNGQKGLYMLRASKRLSESLETAHGNAEMGHPYHMPMVVKPNDWTNLHNGGYLTNDASGAYSLIKTDWKILETLKPSEDFFKAVNVLQSTAYRINQKVLDVVLDIHKEGTGMAGTPDFRKEVVVPQKPWASNEERLKIKEETPETYKAMISKLAQGYRDWHDETSKRTTFCNQVRLAKKFSGYREIFFTWTADFRGRLYPQQSALNPQTDDVAKGLLEFAHGKPLGTNGARWLKIHGANCFGIDKVSFDDRVAWVDEHQEAILESAANPLDGSRFWTKADEPFEFLAFCFAYQGYHKEGLDYVCHLPICIDGSCNGLQHLSMMLKDPAGTKVNLVEREIPGDIYEDAAFLVNQMVHEDKESTDAQINMKLSERKSVITPEDIQHVRNMASLWSGKVSRSIVKRNIMTICYGATRKGFQDQLMDAVRKEDKDYLGTNDEDVIYKACAYLAGKTWEAACNLLPIGMDCLEWFQEVGREYGKVDARIGYTTPIGFPVVMDYPNSETTRVSTYWGGTRKTLTLLERQTVADLGEGESTVNVRKLSQATAPNFVHSLDACHMQMVLLEADRRGMRDFKCVHDSFGTHACDMEEFHGLVWETFRDLYKDDLLSQMFQQIREYAMETNGVIPATTCYNTRGNLEVPKTGKPLYFFA